MAHLAIRRISGRTYTTYYGKANHRGSMISMCIISIQPNDLKDISSGQYPSLHEPVQAV